MKNWEKPRIEDIIERLDLEQLTFVNNERGGYYSACCPLHDDKHPSFEVYIEHQNFICHSCHPQYADVISLWMLLNRCTFPQALKQICTPLTDDQIIKKQLETVTTDYFDTKLIIARVNSLFKRHSYEKAYGLVVEAWQFFMEKRYAKLDSFLRRNYV